MKSSIQHNIHPDQERFLGRNSWKSRNGHGAFTLWLTGLSGSGKSTIAELLEKKLFSEGFYVKVLDGDNTRSGLCNDLGFSLDDRRENIRRVSELSKMLNQTGVITINSFVSPTEDIRQMASQIIGDEYFFEVFVDAPLDICEDRDVKGLYKKARRGEITNFTGIDSPYEAPQNPACHIQTSVCSAEQGVEQLYQFVKDMIKDDL